MSQQFSGQQTLALETNVKYYLIKLHNILHISYSLIIINSHSLIII